MTPVSILLFLLSTAAVCLGGPAKIKLLHIDPESLQIVSAPQPDTVIDPEPEADPIDPMSEDAPQYWYNSTHAERMGVVKRASDYYCQTHCRDMCHGDPWCCGFDDCHYGSGRCKCYNICYCYGSGLTSRCFGCDL